MNKFGNTLRATALTAAIAGPALAPTAADAETTPTQAKAAQVMRQAYFDLRNRAEKLVTGAVDPKEIGTVAVKNSPINFSANTGSGMVKEIEVDVYDKPTRTLEGFYISIYTPDGQLASLGSPLPNSEFQITLMEARNPSVEAPKTPADFDHALVTAESLGQYNFNIGKQLDGSWQSTSAHDHDRTTQVFSTDDHPYGAPETTAALNMDDVNDQIAQAGRVLTAAAHHRAIQQPHPVNLQHTHPR